MSRYLQIRRWKLQLESTWEFRQHKRFVPNRSFLSNRTGSAVTHSLWGDKNESFQSSSFSTGLQRYFLNNQMCKKNRPYIFNLAIFYSTYLSKQTIPTTTPKRVHTKECALSSFCIVLVQFILSLSMALSSFVLSLSSFILSLTSFVLSLSNPV